MRDIFDSQRYFSFTTQAASKSVRQYEEKYNRVSEILDENPPLLELVSTDLANLSTGGKRGRRATFTCENLLRVLIVHVLEGSSLRRTEVSVTHNLFLQNFMRLGNRPAPSYTVIDRAIKAVTPQTWKAVNDTLTLAARSEGRASPETLRVDTTVVEANIHFPTDSSLVWDSWRTLYRLIKQARQLLPHAITDRFHVRKVKKLHLFITRYSASPNKRRQRRVTRHQRMFLSQLERMIRSAAELAALLCTYDDPKLWAIAAEIEEFLAKARHVLSVATRAWVDGETVPARERIFSIFEDHVELIKRGRRHKPVEFGHMVLFGQTRDKFITQYDVMEKKIPDSRLPEAVLDRHEDTFGRLPDELVADKGFRGDTEAIEALRDRVRVVAIPQRLSDWGEESFVDLQHFRAGIEGSISVLKRVFGLLRCQYRGFRSFVSHVGLGVFCHNLVLLTRPT